MIFKIIIWSILISLILRFVFRFLLPIMQVTSMAQSKMREMQKQMEEMQKQSQNNNAKAQPSRPRNIEGDYIDYEEVK